MVLDSNPLPLRKKSNGSTATQRCCKHSFPCSKNFTAGAIAVNRCRFRCSRGTHLCVLTCPRDCEWNSYIPKGVIGLVTSGGVAIPIPVKQIEDLQRLLSQKVPCALHAFLKVGQK